MGSVSLVLIFVVLCSSLFHLECLQGQEEVKGYPPSVTCAMQECAPYQVVHTQNEFEIRTYKNSTWMSTQFTTVNYNVAYNAGYINVLKYFKGENQKGYVWNYTQPSLTDIIPKTSYDSIYKVYLYVPQAYQNDTPPAVNGGSEAKPVKLPKRKFAAVRRLDGYLSDIVIQENVATLKSSLKGTPWESAAASPDLSVADYNYPFYQTDGRVNEVILWFD